MTEARDLFRRYLEQQAELGTGPLVFPAGREPARPAPQTPARENSAAGETDAGRAKPPREPKKSSDSQAAPPIPGTGIVVTAPPKDLFTEDPLASATMEDIERMVRNCTRCQLHRDRTNGVPGEGPIDARLVVVGEGPGANEDAQGRPFVGRAGDLLNDILAAIGCPRETVYIANIIKSRPPNNRKPQADEIEACVPYLHRQLEIIGPKVIVALGATAAETLLNTRGSLSSLRNKVHEYRGIPLIVTYHPAALLRNPHWKRPTWDDVRIARQLLDR